MTHIWSALHLDDALYHNCPSKIMRSKSVLAKQAKVEEFKHLKKSPFRFMNLISAACTFQTAHYNRGVEAGLDQTKSYTIGIYTSLVFILSSI